MMPNGSSVGAVTVYREVSGDLAPGIQGAPQAAHEIRSNGVDLRRAVDVNPLMLQSNRGKSGHLRTPLASWIP